jgi:hypothetical protein
VQTIVESGVSEALLNSRLAALENYFTGSIDLALYEGQRQTSDLADDISGIGGAGFDDIDITDSTWSGGSITNAAISGGSISGATFSGTSLSLSGDATVDDLVAATIHILPTFQEI